MLPDDQNNIQALALTQTSTLSQPTGSLARVPQDVPMQLGAAVNLGTYLHAFRRNWLLALGLGLLFAAIVGPAVWFGIRPWYTASVYLRVAYQKEAMVFANADRTDESEFENFKSTQVQLIQNRFVLSTALKKPEDNPIFRLEILKEQVDPIAWLSKNISVSFPGKSELMQISIGTYNPREAALIVTAVLEAYMSEVVDSEKDQRRQRISELDRLYTDKDQEVRNKRNELKQLAEQLGTAETENLSLKQKLTLEELASYRQELVRSQFEVGRLRGDLASRNAELEIVKNTPISDLECEMFAQSDPVLKNLSQEIMWRRMDSQYTSGALKPGGKKSNKFLDKYQGELDQFQRDYDERMEKVKEEIMRKRLIDVEREIKRVQAGIEITTKQRAANDDDVQRLRKLAEQFGSSSVDVEMLRATISNLEKSLDTIASEREKLRVELRSASRVTALPPRKAEQPSGASNFPFRVALTVLATLVGLCLPVGGLVLWDIQYHRINTSAEVREGLGIPVIGSLPIIPSRVLRHLGSPSRRNQLWQLRLTESVDGITARLLRRAELEQQRVVMVTSAVGGEGKTTLAAQLAMSLARAGRRTMLVDFDLRQPSFDDAFGLPRSPGVSEILRKGIELSEAIQSKPIGNLPDNLSFFLRNQFDLSEAIQSKLAWTLADIQNEIQQKENEMANGVLDVATKMGFKKVFAVGDTSKDIQSQTAIVLMDYLREIRNNEINLSEDIQSLLARNLTEDDLREILRKEIELCKRKENEISKANANAIQWKMTGFSLNDLSEMLRKEIEISKDIQLKLTCNLPDNLSVITAGRWNRMALSALANGGADSLFKELRDGYEFVVIDTSPILPIADARFVSQYVDSVVLCVFRDVSEAPRIRAACEILEAFGVQCIEAAVAGAGERDSGRSGYYHSSVPA